MTSSALGQFRNTVGTISRVLALERSFPDPAPASKVRVIEGLRGATAVLLVAAFENFIKSFIAESISLFNAAPGFRFESLPAETQVASAFGTLERAMYGGQSAPRKDRLPDVRVAAGVVATGKLDPEAFTDLEGNPSARPLRGAFKALSIRDVFAYVWPEFDRKWQKPEAQRYLQDKLDEIVSRRHVVAHTANCLNISRGQLQESLRFLYIFARAIDIAIGAHVKSLSGRAGAPIPPTTPEHRPLSTVSIAPDEMGT